MLHISYHTIIHWLFVGAELLLVIYHSFREKRNWVALSILLLLIIYDFVADWQVELPLHVAINVVGIMLVVMTMLLDFFRKRPVLTPPEVAEDDRFALNCQKYILSVREIQVAYLVRKGYKNRKIAEDLHISEKTVDTHLRNIYEKVGVRTKLELNNKLNE